DGEEHPLKAGQAIDIPRGSAHRVKNPGQEALSFIEVQTGDYFGEDDIERLEDDYGRTE
ncbi:Mannose-1-phosphate guanylyltransferase / Mannose-6-phosphate isomerase, partial [hydrothermal vent metagenome]